MAGQEAVFTGAILAAIHANSLDYVELGLWQGRTISRVRDICVNVPGLKWRLFGVDRPGYAGDAVNLGIGESLQARLQPSCSISVYLCGSERFLLQCGLSPHFIFVDACHGYDCVRRDFLAAEQVITKGGTICFHDTDKVCQGSPIENHCGDRLDVRRAIEELGLLNNKRHGWRMICETPGNRIGGNGMVFLRRVDD